MEALVALTAVINKAVEIGANLIVETGSHLSRLKEDVEWIERQMKHFRSCLKDAESKQDGRHEVANLINDMRDLAMEIEDILDTHAPEIESHKGKGLFRLVKHAACIICYGHIANAFSQKIEKIKELAQDIEATRERCRIILDTDRGNPDMDVWNRRKKFLVSPESVFVGRKDTLQELEQKLRISNSECKMICIVGAAGVGKTTVGKKIYKEMQNEFTSSAVVYVSSEPRLQDLLLAIAKQVGLEKEKMEENLEVNLRSLLNERRCLIFLDDIWTTEAWDELEKVIPINSRNGSRIIITSRYKHVGRYIGDESSLIELKLLDKEKSWELFSELTKSSSENTNERFPPIELEDIAKKIVERCGGLPLAIVVAVGMLRQRRRDKHAWKEVLDSFSTSAENSCSKILSLSYKDLPPDLRPFFLYFGLYPEDHEFSRSLLVKAWVTEKLIQVDGIRNPNDIGAAKLEKLSERNLIQVSKRNLDGRVKNCRIHDLLHVLCIEIAKENNFFCTCRNIHSNSFSTLRRLTVDNTSQYPFSNSTTPKLRTLFCFSNSGEELSSIPNEIGNLSSLTYLKFSGIFRRMPSTIRNLKKLVTLDGKQARFSCAIPICVFRMKSLKHLLLPYSLKHLLLSYFPLQTRQSLKHLLLPYFSLLRLPNTCIYFNVEKELYLPNIETLDGLEGKDVWEASSLQKLSNLRMLSIMSVYNRHIDVISGTTPISEKLEDLRLRSFYTSKRLDMSHYVHLATLHLERDLDVLMRLEIEYPPNLIKLTLDNMIVDEDEMKVLKKLPKLEILRLRNCENHWSSTLDLSGENSFPELQVLAIFNYNCK